jgi:type III secretion system YscQ/HrcQ family protein
MISRPASIARPHGACLADVGPLPERLRELPPWQASASRLLFDARFKRLFPPGCIAVATWTAQTDMPLVDEHVGVHLQFAGSDGQGSALVLCRRDEPLAHAVDPLLPPELQALVLQAALKPSAAWTQALGLADVQAVAADFTTEPGDPAPHLEVRWAMGAARQGTVRLTALNAAALRSVRDRIIGAPPPRRLRSLHLPVRFVFGRRQLPVARADALRPGDVLLPESALAAAGAMSGHLIAGETAARHWIAEASCRDTVITIEERPVMSNGSAKDKSAAALGEHALPINELDVPISFELETSSLTLAQLEAIEPGYVFELPIPVHGASVRLSVYGQVIGAGELVSVGDQLGVRILRIGASHAIGTSH